MNVNIKIEIGNCQVRKSVIQTDTSNSILEHYVKHDKKYIFRTYNYICLCYEDRIDKKLGTNLSFKTHQKFRTYSWNRLHNFHYLTDKWWINVLVNIKSLSPSAVLPTRLKSSPDSNLCNLYIMYNKPNHITHWILLQQILINKLRQNMFNLEHAKYSYMRDIYIFTHNKCIFPTKLECNWYKCICSLSHYLQTEKVRTR